MISGYSNINGIRMYYEIHGEGYPLVLLHGGGSTIQTTFGRIIPYLSKKRKLIAIELQAHGRAEDRDKQSSFEQDADDAAGLLRTLNIPKADFMGFSNGGNGAMQAAIRHPELVNKLIIVSSFYQREGLLPGFFEGMEQASLDNMPADLKKAYLKEMTDFISEDVSEKISREQIENLAFKKLEAMFIRDKTRMLKFFDWKDEDLKWIKSPALIIAGDRDVATPEHTVKMHKLISNSRLAIIPGIHGECLGEITTLHSGKWKQEYIVNLIEDFLDKDKI